MAGASGLRARRDARMCEWDTSQQWILKHSDDLKCELECAHFKIAGVSDVGVTRVAAGIWAGEL